MRTGSAMNAPSLDRRTLVAASLLAPWLLRANAAEPFPNRPVRLIVPEAPGGAPDIRSRQIAQKLGELWGRQVLVENRPGAAGNLAVEMVARSAADGYTIVMAGIIVFALLPHLTKQSFDPLADFVPVTKVSAGPLVLAAHPDIPFASVADLVKYARAHPGQPSAAAGAPGSATHLGIVLFNRSTGASLTHIPYAGSSQPFTDVAGGVVPLVFNYASALRPFLQSGRIKALAVAGERRLAILPDVPTFEELGIGDMRITGWQGIFAPAGTPPAVVRALNEALVKVLALPDIREAFASTGAEVGGDAPEVFAAFVRAEHARWGKVIREGAIKLD